MCLLKCTVPNDVPQWRPSIVQCNPVRFVLIFHAQAQLSKRCRPKAAELGFRVMQACSATFIVSNSVIPIFRIVRERLLQRRKEQRSKFNWQLTNLGLFVCLFVVIPFGAIFIQSSVYSKTTQHSLSWSSFKHLISGLKLAKLRKLFCLFVCLV